MVDIVVWGLKLYTQSLLPSFDPAGITIHLTEFQPVSVSRTRKDLTFHATCKHRNVSVPVSWVLVEEMALWIKDNTQLWFKAKAVATVSSPLAYADSYECKVEKCSQ